MTIDPRITEAIATFPATFALRAYPDRTYRISDKSSYIDDNDRVTLYTQVLLNGQWRDFIKGSVTELRREVLELAPAPSGKAKELVAALELGEATARRVVLRGQEFRGAAPEANLAGFSDGTPKFHAFIAGFIAACPLAIKIVDGKIA